MSGSGCTVQVVLIKQSIKESSLSFGNKLQRVQPQSASDEGSLQGFCLEEEVMGIPLGTNSALLSHSKAPFMLPASLRL